MAGTVLVHSHKVNDSKWLALYSVSDSTGGQYEHLTLLILAPTWSFLDYDITATIM